ncbi:bacterio-opsin activator domain-containing protein [Halorussus marinus]|uniref:bacterio-opsin activator domain-containing protein n=1 Tax=Halorussus marinus TaxID=2505976 RepID=UPI00106EC153|nr:bacterio-opsin activator domain-containing protein [Halorussus marinus]
MDTTRSPRDASGPVSVLLVGPEPWRERVRPALGGEGLAARSVGDREEALGAVTGRSSDVDCVVSAHRLDAGTGLDLLEALGSAGSSVAFVLAPIDGTESLAGEAVAAGVDGYVPIGDGGADDDLASRCETAVARAREDRDRAAKASRFEAFFADPDRFVAVLDPDGTVVRANPAALDTLGLDESAAIGKRFWGLPWVSFDDSRRDLQRAVRRGAAGEYATFEAGLAGDDRSRFEFTVRPVGDDVTGLVVEGHEVAERVRLEEELRESEELHRVTLNNMTDTVLVTDDDGAFTYVCPNVHFIFGYSVEELYEFGTIDELLGEDLFDRDRLDAENVLTNVECTATDKHGREHTLLVNVRQVSIQGGTTLYSCRDITKRKQRETALTQLHQTSRNLLYAETKSEIATEVVTDATAVLRTPAAAVYRFDREANALVPAAVAGALDERAGGLAELSPDRTTAVSRAFVDEQTTTRADADRDGVDPAPLSEFGDFVAVPLGDHGVFVAAAADPDAFDEVSEEVAELLAATAEAAFDRIERETELRERDRTLQRQNRRLSQLNRVNEFIREIDQALVGARTRETIEEAVCDRLTSDDRFAFAWIGETAASDATLRSRAWAGDERGYLDSVSLEPGVDAAGVEPSVRTATEREATFVSNVADRLRDAEWCPEAAARGFQSVLSIPLAYDDVLFGTLTVYANEPAAFDEMVRSVLCELGDTVASAINAVQRTEALRSDTTVELEYRIADRSAVLYRLAEETGAALRAESDLTREDGTTLVFVTVEGAPLDRVVDAAAESVGITSVEALRETDDGGLVCLRVGDHFLTRTLADHGALVRELRATPEGLSLTVDVPDSVSARSIDEVISNAYPGADLIAQRERTRPLDTRGRPGRLADELTDRQLEVAQVAYHSGFFDSQRDVTGRDVAAMLDISHTAFYDHVNRIQRKLFASLLETAPGAADVE